MKKNPTVFTTIPTSFKAFLLTLIISIVSAANGFANRIDSDLSNTAGTNSGKSHLDIYLFIVALLVICVVIPFWEDKHKSKQV